MVRKNLLICIVAFATAISGCDGKGGSSVSTSENSTTTNSPQESLKPADTMLKSIRSISITDEKAIVELKHILSLGYENKAKVAAIEKLSKFSHSLTSDLLKEVWKNFSDEMLRSNAIKALVFQNTETSRNALKEVLESKDKNSKLLLLNLIGYTAKLDFKAVVDTAINDADVEVSTLAKKIQNQLKKS